MNETAWKKALVDHLGRPNSGLKVWFQPAGDLVVKQKGRKRRIVMAPKGAADLAGFGPGGVHLEIEAKVDEPWKAHQRSWARTVARMGAIYILARYDKSLDLEENLELVEQDLRAALAERTGSTRHRGGEASTTPRGAPYGKGCAG